MIKEAINFLAAPVYSFSIFIGLFFLAMKRMDIVGTKKFGIGLLVFTLVTDSIMSKIQADLESELNAKLR